MNRFKRKIIAQKDDDNNNDNERFGASVNLSFRRGRGGPPTPLEILLLVSSLGLAVTSLIIMFDRLKEYLLK